jgi:hypothetical protein
MKSRRRVKDAVGQERQAGRIAGDLIKAARPRQRGRRYRLASTLGNAARLASPDPYSSLGLGGPGRGPSPDELREVDRGAGAEPN